MTSFHKELNYQDNDNYTDQQSIEVIPQKLEPEIKYDDLVTDFEDFFSNLLNFYSEKNRMFEVINLYSICKPISKNRYKISTWIYKDLELIAYEIMEYISQMPNRTSKKMYKYDYIEYNLIKGLNKYKIIYNMIEILSYYYIFDKNI